MRDFIWSVLVDNVSSFSFRHKFLNTLKNIDIEINVLFVVFLNYFCVAFSWL